jgi:hypothetical protein
MYEATGYEANGYEANGYEANGYEANGGRDAEAFQEQRPLARRARER